MCCTYTTKILHMLYLMSVPETADRAGSAEVFQLLLGVNRIEKNHLCPLAYLVGDGTLQPVQVPLLGRHPGQAEEALDSPVHYTTLHHSMRYRVPGGRGGGQAAGQHRPWQ